VLCIGAPQARLDSAIEAGASAVMNIETNDVSARLDWVRQQTSGRGADVTIEVAGVAEAVVQAMQFTRDAGRVVVVGQYTDHGSVGVNFHTDLNKKHLDVRGCWGSDFSHFYRGTQLVSEPSRASAWQEMKLTKFSLSDTNEALASVAGGRVMKALIDPNQE